MLYEEEGSLVPSGIYVSSICVLLLGLAPAAYAQAVRGSLVGSISDASGALIPGAKVVITNTGTRTTRATATNEGGGYAFPSLESGVYSVAVEHPGFRRAVRDQVEVPVNATVRVDFLLQPGEVSETVQVRAEAPILQTDRSDTGRLIERRQLADLPLGFNRNFGSLISLSPGVGRAFRPHSEFYNSQDSLSVRVNGLGRTANNFQFEGVSNYYRSGLLLGVVPPIEALAEVSISTSNYEAELGMGGGAVVNIILRSGSNELHGSAFHFNRVSRLGARNVFSQTKARNTYNLYGFTLGGPIRRDKTFAFGDFQGIRDRRGDINRATIPTREFRNGDLSASQTTIYDPATGLADGTGRVAFPGNIIPPSRISPISRRILELVPLPTFSGLQTNFEKPTVREKNSESFDIKLDHNFDPNNSLSYRYSFQRPVTLDPPLFGMAGGPRNNGFAGRGRLKSHSTALNYNHIFSPSFLVENRFGVMRYRNDARNLDYGTKATEELGIPGVNVSEFTGGLTSIHIDGFSSPLVGYAASLPWVYAETHFNAVSNWTKIFGSHTIKYGVDARRYRDDQFNGEIFGVRGAFRFNDGTTARNGDPRTSFANSFASFLLDVPNQYGRDLPVAFPTIRQTAIMSYVQDKWQVSRRLTLDIGLRHELILPISASQPGQLSNYDPSDNTLRVAGIGSVPLDLGVRSFYRYFAPRFGYALRLNEKTVFRGGYGISILPNRYALYASNFPVSQTNAFNALNSFSPAGSMARGFPPPIVAVIPSNGIIPNPPDLYYSTISRDLKEGYVQSWNVTLQRALPRNFTVEAAYVGTRGVGVKNSRNINASTRPGSGAAGQPLFQRFGRLAQTDEYFYPLNTHYHSMQVKFDRRFTGGFLLTTSYTYGKAINYADDNGALFIPAFVALNRGRASHDATHIFVQSYIYELPFGRNKRWLQGGAVGAVFGGWQVNGIFTSQTGFPLNFTYSAATLNAPGNGNRPNVNGKPKIFGRVGRGELWFDTSQFSAPPSNTFGTVGRNVLSGPGLVNLDLSVFRRFALGERVGLEFRFESLNFTNTPHFLNPNTQFGNPNFGQVTTAIQDQRQVQFGLKVTF